MRGFSPAHFLPFVLFPKGMRNVVTAAMTPPLFRWTQDRLEAVYMALLIVETRYSSIMVCKEVLHRTRSNTHCQVSTPDLPRPPSFPALKRSAWHSRRSPDPSGALYVCE